MYGCSLIIFCYCCGRFQRGRVIANKDVSKYSAEDKAALFGVTEPKQSIEDTLSMYMQSKSIVTASISSATENIIVTSTTNVLVEEDHSVNDKGEKKKKDKKDKKRKRDI